MELKGTQKLVYDYLLETGGGFGAREIARALKITYGSVYAATNKMARAGLIRRVFSRKPVLIEALGSEVRMKKVVFYVSDKPFSGES